MKGIEKIAILVFVLMALTMLFGCTTPGPDTNDSNAPKVTTQGEANSALNDASTNLSSVKQTLDDIDNTLTE